MIILFWKSGGGWVAGIREKDGAVRLLHHTTVEKPHLTSHTRKKSVTISKKEKWAKTIWTAIYLVTFQKIITLKPHQIRSFLLSLHLYIRFDLDSDLLQPNLLLNNAGGDFVWRKDPVGVVLVKENVHMRSEVQKWLQQVPEFPFLTDVLALFCCGIHDWTRRRL